MATSTRENASTGDDNNPASTPAPVPNGEAVKTWTQPTRYHQISATGRERGYFIRVPHLPVIDDIARSYGPEMAQIWYKAALRQLTQLGQARGSAKDVAKTREAEQAAIEKAFAEFASGSLIMRGDDTDEGESTGVFNKALKEAASPMITEALEKAGKPVTADYIDLAFTQYYSTLVERFGGEVAARGYVPTKKGAAKAEGEKISLDLALA